MNGVKSCNRKVEGQRLTIYITCKDEMRTQIIEATIKSGG